MTDDPTHPGPGPLPSATHLDEATLPGAGEDVPPGRWLDMPRYVLGAELGRGGGGRVLAALDTSIGREVALKEILGPPTGSIHQRFLREATLTARLEHPGIVPVYDVSAHADGRSFYTMKIIRGETLARRLDRAIDLDARLALLPAFLHVCQAVAFAHARGVIHRDLKPGNIMIGEFGETIVLDWGIARRLEDGPDPGTDPGAEPRPSGAPAPRSDAGDAQALTRDGQRIGTPLYMSPEQADGRVRDIDARSDVWSLGLILFQILAGDLPFQSRGVALLAEIVGGPPITVRAFAPRAPAELVAIAERCLSREKERRYANASQLADEVERYITGGLVEAYRYGLLRRVARGLRRHRTALLASALGAVAAGVAALFVLGRVVFPPEGRPLTAPERAAISRSLGEANFAALLPLATEPGNAAVEIDRAVRGCLAEDVAAPGCLELPFLPRDLDLDTAIATLERPELASGLRPYLELPEIEHLRRAGRLRDYQMWGAVRFPQGGLSAPRLPIPRYWDLLGLGVLLAERARLAEGDGRVDEAEAMLADLARSGQHLDRDILVAAVLGSKLTELAFVRLAGLHERRGAPELAARFRAAAARERERRSSLASATLGRDVASVDLWSIVEDEDALLGLRIDAHLGLLWRSIYSTPWLLWSGPPDEVRARLFARPSRDPGFEVLKLVTSQDASSGFFARAAVLIDMATWR